MDLGPGGQPAPGAGGQGAQGASKKRVVTSADVDRRLRWARVSTYTDTLGSGQSATAVTASVRATPAGLRVSRRT